MRITCSAKFKYAQMNYDKRIEGFPLLQNIVLQQAFREDNYDPESGKDYSVYHNRIKGNIIGCFIKYISTPGYFYRCNADTVKLDNYIMLTPYLDANTTTFKKVVPSGQYLVLIGMWTCIQGTIKFDLSLEAWKSNTQLIPNYETNDIDLSLYTDFKNDIKSSNFKERKTLSLERAKKDFFKDENYGKIQYKSLEELQIKYGKYLKLLDDIKLNKINGNLKWGIIKTEYAFYIGQFNENNLKEGKGLYISQNNIFTGIFENDEQNGKGYTYNKNFEKLFYCTYDYGLIVGKPVTVEEELLQIEKQKQQEQERMLQEQEQVRKVKEEKEALLKKKEKELILFLLKGTNPNEKILQDEVIKNISIIKNEAEEEKQRKAQEAKQQLEEIKNEIKQVKDKEKQLEDNIEKNYEDIRKALEARAKINEMRTKKELERLEREAKEEDFGIQLVYPEYLKNRPKKDNNYHEIENPDEDICSFCTCIVF